MQERIFRSGRGRHDARVLFLTVLLALVAILWGRASAVAGATIFEDNFDVAFEGWMTTGSPDWYSKNPSHGTHSIQLRKDEAIERLIPTVGYTDITVSFALGASSLDRSTEVVRALWYDGSQWGVLHAIGGGGGEDDGQLHTFSVSLPSGASDNADFRLRFEIVANSANDYGYVDDVLVSGELPVRTLTVDGQGTGSIRVDSVAYDLPWSGDFSPGASVTLEAVPGDCWAFTGWAGDLGGSDNPVVVALDTDIAVTADFSQLEYALALDAVGTGSVKVDGELVSLPWSGQYACGTNVTLEGVPGAGWAFGSWGGDVSSTNPSIVVTMDAPKTITATFSQESYALSLAKVGSGSAKVNGTLRSLPWSGSFLSGTSVTLEGVPGAGWAFGSWGGDVSSTNPSIVVTMDAPKSLTATFSQESYTLSLAKVGSGSAKVNGTVRSLPWSGSFLSGTSITLEAVPDAGWKFDGWSGDATGSGATLVVTMDAPKSLTATFSQESYTLSLAKVGSGSAKVNGTLRSLPWSGSFLSGTSVTLEAVPDAGWKFDGWSGDATWSGATLVLTMDAPKNITATFSQDGHVLNLSKVGSGSVKVDGTLRSLPWSGSFLSGTSVALEAVPDSGWKFDGWSGDATWSGATLVVTMDAPKNITATFEERDSFILSLSKTGAGAVTVNGMAVSLPWSGELPRGNDVTLQAVPDEGWRFNRWSGDLAGSQNPTVITMNDDWDITAKFAEIHYRLTITAIGAGAAKVNGDLHSLPWSGDFALGTQITLEAVPTNGWDFGGWSGDLSGASNPAVFAMDGDRSITATFVAPDQFELKVTKYGSGSVKVDGVERSLPWSGLFANGAQVELEAVAEADERFVEWAGDATGSANPITLTMDSDKSIKAEFACTAGPFLDVPCDHWAAEAIAAVYDADIASGYSDGCYRPRLAVNRAAMAVFLARGLAGGTEGVPAGPEEPTFGDVPTDHWAFAEVEYVVSRSIAKGYGDGNYHPAWEITRGQMAVFVARAVAEPTGDEGLSTFDAPEAPSFSDVPASMWCYLHVEYLADLGIVTGYSDGLYRPGATVTRDQMAVYVARAFDLLD